MPELKEGQTVYGKPGVNRGRYNKEIVEGTIEKIGRKYFDVRFGYGTYKFHKDTLQQKSEYAADYTIYFDKQELLDEEEYESNLLSIRNWFTSGYGSFHYKQKGLTLDHTREIINILKQTK